MSTSAGVPPALQTRQMNSPKTAIVLVIGFILFQWQSGSAEHLPGLISDKDLQAFSQEISGEAAKRNLEFLSQQHRMRGSRGFHAASEHVVEQLRSYGVNGAQIEKYPTGNRIFYGTQKARLPWDAEFAEMWELRKSNGRWMPAVRLASWDTLPLSLAQDSESGEVTADLVDIGTGLQPKDYQGKNVRGRLVLTSSQPEAVQQQAVGKYGAAGIISYAQNQRTAWWMENENLIRWGHLDSFAKPHTFAFMISLKQARAFQKRLGSGEQIRLHAKVRAGKHPGHYEIATATIPGSDPQRAKEEIVFSCHMDHPRPGANDNASGCATILEVARTFSKMIAEGKIAKPKRTLRFVWPPEIEGTAALLNAKKDFSKRAKAAIHLDMVGGGPETKAVFHITRGPASLPSFIYDVADAVGRFVNDQADTFASTGEAEFPLIAAEGGKEALLAVLAPFSMGSDHEVYTDSSFSIPSIYLNDWPDRYIHTNFDVPGNIDPTKLKRAAFIAAVSGYVLANLDSSNSARVWKTAVQPAVVERAAALLRTSVDGAGQVPSVRREFSLWYENSVIESFAGFGGLPPEVKQQANDLMTRIYTSVMPNSPTPSSAPVNGTRWARKSDLRGPMSVFGYDYFQDHYGPEKAKAIKLLQHKNRAADGGLYAYEVLNLADGTRTTGEIWKFVSAAYGAVPQSYIEEYLLALESIGVVQRR